MHMCNEIMMGCSGLTWQNYTSGWREMELWFGGCELLVTGGCSLPGPSQIPSDRHTV